MWLELSQDETLYFVPLSARGNTKSDSIIHDLPWFMSFSEWPACLSLTELSFLLHSIIIHATPSWWWCGRIVNTNIIRAANEMNNIEYFFFNKIYFATKITFYFEIHDNYLYLLWKNIIKNYSFTTQVRKSQNAISCLNSSKCTRNTRSMQVKEGLSNLLHGKVKLAALVELIYSFFYACSHIHLEYLKYFGCDNNRFSDIIAAKIWFSFSNSGIIRLKLRIQTDELNLYIRLCKNIIRLQIPITRTNSW